MEPNIDGGTVTTNGNGHGSGSPAGGGLFCGGCGARWGADQGYCAECGAARPSPVPAPEPASAEPTVPVPVSVPFVPAVVAPTGVEVTAATALPMEVASPAPKRRRRTVVIIAAVVAVVAAGALLVPVLLGGDGKGSGLEATVTSADSTLGAAAHDLAAADGLTQVREAGVAAKAVLDPLNQDLEAIGKTGDAKTRNAAENAIEAHRDLATAWGAVADISEETPEAWGTVSEGIRDATSEWRQAQNQRTSAGLPAFDGALRRTVESASDDTRDWLGTAAASLQDWKDEVGRVTDTRTADLAALDAYASTVRPQLVRYSELRKSLSGFTARMESGDMSWSEAYGGLSDAADDRQEVRSAIAQATPPQAVTGAHTGLLTIVDRAVSAVHSASEGLREYQYGYYSNWTDTPAWQTFQDQGTGITAGYGDAVSAWEQQVGAERARLEANTPPAKPSI